MDVFTAIKKRYSARKYLDKPVERHNLAVVLEAARHAPSSGNLQPWKFIVIEDKSKRHSIAEACQKQYWMTQAPVHIVVTAEIERINQFYGIRGERLYAIQNCAAAIENMMLAATGLGLATCWVGYFDEEKIRDLCRIPAKSRPQAIITLGYSLGEEKVEKLPIDNIVFFGNYGMRLEHLGRAFYNWSDEWVKQGHKLKDNVDKHKSKLEIHLAKASKTIKEHFQKLNKKIQKAKQKDETKDAAYEKVEIYKE